MSNEPSKVSGQYNSAVGSAKEAVGNVTGASSWTQAGQEQHAKGEAEIKAATAKQYADGVSNQVSGKVDNLVGTVTGDDSKKASGKAQEQAGKLQKDTA
ncbi:unnamed protein product [Tilletia controversa]|uniref:CsbD-like domain-containing protein n=3 Tax=Tilletia TaxID=13289 RepID=A0A8X7SXQ2_9BASI|nr:hypothetical protein CF336_g3689 [Tilletia laevis]KAE8198764.1 hypothetical protein CF328_g3453 [Tilletia controversa]KAE8261626.1 hypothetical protein A4X03_0g3093 [Tilletia caries]KAE8203744.1 hypothetical protein CF335_g2905 [Tilletia laevis]KAE8248126.1 hypothetical protein A4X06_0g3945 [Tilletia controversa]